MLRLAGELADGVILWLCEPGYIREVVVPEVTKGREKAGKPLDGFDIVAAVPSAVTDDPDAARDTMRNDLIPYFSLPFYRAMIERLAGLRARHREGATRFIDTLAAIGTAERGERGRSSATSKPAPPRRASARYREDRLRGDPARAQPLSDEIR